MKSGSICDPDQIPIGERKKYSWKLLIDSAIGINYLKPLGRAKLFLFKALEMFLACF
jgi:hypothetical protein